VCCGYFLRKVLNYVRVSGSTVLPPRVGRLNPYIRDGRVLVAKVRSTDIRSGLRSCFEVLGGLSKLIRSGDRVVIKPNVGFAKLDAVTNPAVVRALIELIKSEVSDVNIVIAESAVSGLDTSLCFKLCGYHELAKELGVELIDLKRSGHPIKVSTRGGALRSVKVYKEVYDCDVLISVPKLKRHVEATVTISLKNMMGAIPDSEKSLFHLAGLSSCIADLNTAIRPDLVVIDATEVMIRHGPQHGNLVKANTIFVSGDPVAADLIAATYLFELEGCANPLEKALEVKHIKYAAERGVGTCNVDEIEVIDLCLP